MPKNLLLYIHAFNCTQCVGPKTFEKLLAHFEGDLSRAWIARAADFARAGLSESTAEKIIEKRGHIDPEAEFEKLARGNIAALTPFHGYYPPLLKESAYPPAIMYLRGTYPKEALVLAVVGTRRPSAYGRQAAEHITRGLARSGIAIASGLALGIDGMAHKAALEESAPTVAVLGSGVDDNSIYPTFHRPLARAILEKGGAIISEFPPGTPALKQNFPQRNRIIAGISRGTLVVEAKQKSGALITARYALEYNRDVFAVPGPIFSALSEGPNTLLHEGATAVLSPRDILAVYGIDTKISEMKKISLGETEQKILELLDAPRAFDELRTALSCKASVLNASLAMLELNDCVTNLGNQTYIRKR